MPDKPIERFWQLDESFDGGDLWSRYSEFDSLERLDETLQRLEQYNAENDIKVDYRVCECVTLRFSPPLAEGDPDA